MIYSQLMHRFQAYSSLTGTYWLHFLPQSRYVTQLAKDSGAGAQALLSLPLRGPRQGVHLWRVSVRGPVRDARSVMLTHQ